MRSGLGILLLGSVLWTVPAHFSNAVATDTNDSARADWLARTWQTDEGLPDNNVTGVAQAADGYIWVATAGGLIRFDGANFERFSTAHLLNVPNLNVRKMYLDRRGRFWLSMDRGLLIRVEGKKTRVFDARDGLTAARPTAIAEDAEGGTWLVRGSVIHRIHGDTVDSIGAKEGLPSGGSSWLATDVPGNLWFARGTKVGVLRNGRWETKLNLDSIPVRFAAARSGGLWICTATQVLRFNEGQPPQQLARLPGGVTVTALLEDQAGALWIGTGASGLLRLEGSELRPVPVSHPEISVLSEDREGNLWVGTTGGGLNVLRSRAMNLITTKTGLPFESVRSVCGDTDGWIWLAMQNGSVVRGRGSHWATVGAGEGWTGGDATCVAPAPRGGVWIGTHDRGLQKLHAGKMLEWGRREGLRSQNIRSVLQAANGDLWLGTEAPNRLCVFRDNAFREIQMPVAGVRSIRALAEGVDGVVWAGTSDGQVLRIEGDTAVDGMSGQREPLISVRCLHTTADGSLWIGFAGGGVGRLFQGHFSRITVKEGLLDNYVSQILSDRKGGVWLTCSRGLFQVRLEEMVGVAEGRKERLRSIAYGRSEGLPSLQPSWENTPTAWRGADGQVWFSMRNGLLTVNSDRIRDNPTPPPVLLRDVKMDDRLVALYESDHPLRAPAGEKLADLKTPGLTLELAPRHNKIEFNFTALSFNSPENVHFRYRLRGFDQVWIEAGPQRSARYPRLAAGRYDFEVTACNEVGVWNDTGCRIAIVVPPLFWQTWWFRLSVLALFTLTVTGLVRNFSVRRLRRELERLERQAQLQKERTRIARDMHDEVGAKLSRLSLLSELASGQRDMPPAVRCDVDEISETARETIRSFEEIVWAVNPRNDSLADLVQYLCRFAEEFFEGSATQCAFELPDDIPPVTLATEVRHHVSLAAKEALNNVFKHAEAGRVLVRVRVMVGSFEIQIQDDGHGFALGDTVPREGGGNGLHNMRERLKAAGGEFVLRSHRGKGTVVVFRVPLSPVSAA